jgi:ketosteroid isomerase-like protein
MTEPVPRTTVEAFYRVYGAQDLEGTAAFLADDVEWTISGPIDVLLFCGTHRGKAAVIRMMERVVPQVFDTVTFELITLLIDGNRVAALNRLTAKHKGDGRVISYRLAHFLRFRDGKIVENLSLLDSFDAAEQVLGHPLTAQERVEGDLIAV